MLVTKGAKKPHLNIKYTACLRNSVLLLLLKYSKYFDINTSAFMAESMGHIMVDG